MARKTVVTGSEQQAPEPEPVRKSPEFSIDNPELDDDLRPQSLKEVIGQRKVIERVRIMLEAAQTRGDALGHLLLEGPPGLGKTTLAMVLPKELGSDFQITSGPTLRAPKDLLPYLTRASEKSVLFIDEIHRLPPAVEEFIYPAMEDFRVDIALGDGLNARTVNMSLKPFTIVGATTRSGMLTAPLRDRFVNRAHFDFYEHDDLTTLLIRNARKLRTELTEDAAQEIATRSRGTPRKANNLLRWTRDFAQVRQKAGPISGDVAREALAMIEIDAIGLEEMDRRYLMTLITVFTGGPAGIQAIGHSMNVPPDTLEDEVEPFLLRQGFIQRTPRGRMVTAAAWEHLKIPPLK
ncbi:Holliday junction branch migration DNA helicase RuvB [Rubinisphaera margarita]|uniref:Holliday junction branch migration DNA helicase RuvB n=1 Tax=Rubinisphaera margarita TaxID=2909586 RepID=UPI001EE944A9|nr:Holliday junction branch migration DNA helicase RuvB [Rubinisphaera margarita]MCG6154534.1 Holliday junction branch migration DNA helicase RuvB [Rubinisphaera margarita]